MLVFVYMFLLFYFIQLYTILKPVPGEPPRNGLSLRQRAVYFPPVLGRAAAAGAAAIAGQSKKTSPSKSRTAPGCDAATANIRIVRSSSNTVE